MSTGEQPPPLASTGPAVVDVVIADLRARASRGLRTYGRPLQPFNGRDAARDAYEEALDQAKYLCQLALEWRALREAAAELLDAVDVEHGDHGGLAEHRQRTLAAQRRLAAALGRAPA